MARPLLPPRLYLRARAGSAPTWVIRYRGTEIGTGLRESDRVKAEEMLAAYDETRRQVRRRRHRYPTGHIYFISCPDDPRYPVKVGYSGASVYMRLANVQVGNPHRLAVLLTCEAHHAVETHLHLRLAEDRMLGEWFARSRDVEEAMRAASEGRLEEWLGMARPAPPELPVEPPTKKRSRGLTRVLEVASERPLSKARPYRPAAER